MKRGVRIWEEPLEIFDGVLGSNLAALGTRCWAFRFGHVKNSFPFLETGFGHFLWFVNTQFSCQCDQDLCVSCFLIASKSCMTR
jgi:hypothetical protein